MLKGMQLHPFHIYMRPEHVCNLFQNFERSMVISMISSQVIKSSIDELYGITKVELGVFDLDGMAVASTFGCEGISKDLITNFAAASADSQVIGREHLLKVRDEGEAVYVLIARGEGEGVYMIGKLAVCQLQNLIIAYKERLDCNSFFQNLLLDNLLLVDVYNRARRLHIEASARRVIMILETENGKDGAAAELLRGMFSARWGDYITAVDERNVVLVKAMEAGEGYEEVEHTAQVIVDMMNTEAMMNVKVGYGTIVNELKDLSKSFKEAKMALEVGRIFYAEKRVNAYNTLGIGRLIYQLPVNLCKIFIEEIFGGRTAADFEEETLTTIYKFFDNNLNVSETARQLFVHRNTLVYRIEKLEKATGLDVRTFDDALTFKIALMVVSYMKHLESLEF